MPVRDPYRWYTLLNDLADEARDSGEMELAGALAALAYLVLTDREAFAAALLQYSPVVR